MITLLHVGNFLAIEKSELVLGPKVTLVTGPNGSNKTTHLEALLWCLWGQRLRPGPLAEGAAVAITFGCGELLERVQTPSGERVQLCGAPSIAHRGVWQQKTKILPQLEGKFGTYLAWSRSLHLTGKTVGAFATGTPGGRWDHLVKLTGAGQYDKGIESARKCVKVAEAEKLRQSGEVQSARVVCDMITSTWTSAVVEARGIDPEVFPERIEAWGQELAVLDLRVGRGGVVKADQQELLLAALVHEADAMAHLTGVRVRLRAVLQIQRLCEACGGPIPDPKQVQIQVEVEDAEHLHVQARDARYRAYDVVATTQTKLELLLMERMATLHKIERETGKVERYLQSQDRLWDTALQAVTAQTLSVGCGLRYAAAMEALIHAEGVLGTLVAARMVYLQSYLREMNRMVKIFLGYIGAKATVVLVATGANGLELQTAGTGATSYAQCSGGEQRRIDLCLALAMSEVASRMGNLTQAVPLVIDEAFDTLDEAGMSALLSLACHIAKTRQVLLVSHVLPDLPLGSDILHIRLGP